MSALLDPSFKRSSSELLETADGVLASTYSRPDTLFVDGEGAYLIDATGERYLDMTSGIAVTSLGHRSPVVASAMRDAAGRLGHTSNLYHTAAPIRLAELLVESSFADRVFFCNSGAEAVEGAIKFARLAAAPRQRILYLDGSFHGRTFGALASTDKEAIRRPFEPLPTQFERIGWGDPTGLERIDGSVAAVIAEPIQGEGGIRIPPNHWLADLRRRCDATGTLWIADEIQCGVGRSGDLWAHQASGATPDLMTLAKPLANGLPIGAVLMTEAVGSHLYPGCHGTTFGGGPFVTQVARAVFETIRDPEFLCAVRQKGERFRSALEELDHPAVLEVRGRGLMLGLKVSVDVAAVVARAHAHRLLVVGAGENTVRLLPALSASDEDLGEAVARLERALTEVTA